MPRAENERSEQYRGPFALVTIVGMETTATTSVIDKVTTAKRPPRLSEFRRVPNSLEG